MREVLFDTIGLKIWTDGASPIMFVKFSSTGTLGTDPEKLIRKGQVALCDLIARSENVYSIIDISECNGQCALTLLKFCFSQFPQLLDKEIIKYLAFVYAITHARALESNLSDLLAPYPGLRNGAFKDFYGALGKINAIRQRQFSLNL
jgi:hypothetical protein